MKKLEERKNDDEARGEAEGRRSSRRGRGKKELEERNGKNEEER